MKYSDLAPSDYFLLPNVKKFLTGKQFTSNDQAIAAIEDGYFVQISRESHFTWYDGIKFLEKFWHKCIEVLFDIIEKSNIYFMSTKIIFHC